MYRKEENMAHLKDLMTTPPMTAQRHAEIRLKKIGRRRMAEDAREVNRIRLRDFENLK